MQTVLGTSPCDTGGVLEVAWVVTLDTAFNVNPLLVRFSAVSDALTQAPSGEAEVDVGQTFAG